VGVSHVRARPLFSRTQDRVVVRIAGMLIEMIAKVVSRAFRDRRGANNPLPRALTFLFGETKLVFRIVADCVFIFITRALFK
jgi:hypothetical protein